jgi:PAS domain S-box-containing protein
LFFNEAAARFVGRPAASVIGQTDAEIFEPESARVIREQDCRAMELGRVRTDEEELTAAGVTRTYLVTKAPYWDHAGNVAGVIGISRDITQRKQAERALRSSEERLRALIAAVPDMIFRLDPDGVFVDCKVELSDELIAPPEVFLGKNFREIMPPPIAERIALHIALGRNTGQLQTFEYELTPPQGRRQWYEARLMAAADGHTLVVARNVTQWKLAQENLQKAEQHLRAIIDAEPECVKLLDAEGRILEINAAGLAMIGADDPQQIIGACAFDRVAPEHQAAYRAMHERVLRGAKETLEFDVIGMHDQRLSMETHAVPLWLGGEAQPMHLAITRDVTERKKLEEQFRQSQKMEAVGRLAGGVAHDFNNLLTVISGFSELLQMKLEPESPLRASVQAIQDAAWRAASLTRQLLAFSRKQLLDPTVLNLNDVVSSADEMLRRLIGEDILISVDLQSDLSLVTVDRGQIEQVILNLVVNARDTMPQGGRLTLATRNVSLPEGAALGGSSRRSFVELSVSDTGHGMTEEVKARIFDPFFTTKELGKGTGLGLAVVHGIVSQSGGRIDVDTRLGVGTTFRVLLPAARCEAACAPLNVVASTAPTGHETILLVEDDAAVCQFTSLALSGLGYRVFVANSGRAALDLVDREQPAIDMLVTDVVMPEMGGSVLAELLRGRYPTLKVLFVSGYADDAIGRRGLLQSSGAFLHKPYMPRSLAEKVREVLDEAVPPGRDV